MFVSRFVNVDLNNNKIWFIRRILLTESLNKPRMTVCAIITGNIKSEWKCLFNCSHKCLVEFHSPNKCISVSLYVLQQEQGIYFLWIKYYWIVSTRSCSIYLKNASLLTVVNCWFKMHIKYIQNRMGYFRCNILWNYLFVSIIKVFIYKSLIS